MFCASCGSEITVSSLYCNGCGAPTGIPLNYSKTKQNYGEYQEPISNQEVIETDDLSKYTRKVVIKKKATPKQLEVLAKARAARAANTAEKKIKNKQTKDSEYQEQVQLAAKQMLEREAKSRDDAPPNMFKRRFT